MDWAKLGIAAVELLAAAVEFFKRQQWYQQGVADANAAANAEQQGRITVAQAARAAPDQYANSKLVDPRDRG
jgi:predicted CoA-binding protein